MDNIRLIALDLDGTLIQNNTISTANIQALRDCINKGIKVILVTGRPYCFTKMLAKKIDDRVGVIAANGAICEIGNHIQENLIKDEALPNIIDILKKYSSAHAFFKGKKYFYTHEAYDQRFLYDHMNEQMPSDCRVESFTSLSWDELKQKANSIAKVLVYDFDENKLASLRKEIECIKNISVTDYQKISFDINAEEVNKGKAIQNALRDLQITSKELMAIGDGNNDIPMFQLAGVSIAMGNASEEVKSYCNFVTDDYKNDGVAKAISKYVLHNK